MDRLTVLILFQAREPVDRILSNVQEIYRKKDTHISQSKRLEAEQAYNKADFKKSLALYSQSVIRAPDNGKYFQLFSFSNKILINGNIQHY